MFHWKVRSCRKKLKSFGFITDMWQYLLKFLKCNSFKNFVHLSFTKYLLSICYVSGTVISTREYNKQNRKSSWPWEILYTYINNQVVSAMKKNEEEQGKEGPERWHKLLCVLNWMFVSPYNSCWNSNPCCDGIWMLGLWEITRPWG